MSAHGGRQWRCSMTIDDETLLDIKARAAAVLMTWPGVTAVGIGGRERGGRPTGEVVLKVFVVRKRPLSDLAADRVLPLDFEGVGIDVSELAPSQPDTDPGDDPDAPPDGPVGSPRVPSGNGDDDKYRPLAGGIQVQTAHSSAGTGTLGLILVHKTDAARVFALTNFHVVDSGSESAE